MESPLQPETLEPELSEAPNPMVWGLGFTVQGFFATRLAEGIRVLGV